MKEAIFEIFATLNTYIGSGRIILLFLCAVSFIFYINTYEKTNERRRISPAVFLLSIWSGIAYAFTEAIKLVIKKEDDEDKKNILNNKLFKIVFAIAAIMVAIYITGCFIFMEDYMKESVYYYTNNVITIIAVLSIMAFLILYLLISLELFENAVDRLIFMGIIVILHLFAGYTIDSLKISIFLNPLTVGSVILHDFMPFALLMTLMKLRQEKPEINEDNVTIDDENYEEEWDLKKHKIINIRNTAIAIALLALMFVAGMLILNSKINNLYNATVALEKATEDKISYFELKGKGSDNVIASLMITGEGTAIVTGGGSEENGNDLMKFITDHTTRVDRWYIYSNDEKDRGAFDFCYNKGLLVDDLYLITGIEKADDDN